jgi:hypothetical protein
VYCARDAYTFRFGRRRSGDSYYFLFSIVLECNPSIIISLIYEIEIMITKFRSTTFFGVTVRKSVDSIPLYNFISSIYTNI